MSESYKENKVPQKSIGNDTLRSRKEKLAQLRKNGTAFPNDFHRNAISSQLHSLYGEKNKEELASLNIEVKIAGRMITRRIMGKASFVTMQDMGGKIQLYITRKNLPLGQYNKQFKKWDLGDIFGARGKLFKTQTGELSVRCSEVRLLTKAIRSLPDKFHGLSDPQIRYRQRYLDLIANEKSRNIFKIRSHIIAEIRRFMMDCCFIEVETPMMHAIPGGATADSFMTHHNALGIDVYLRIAPELYLKRLVIGGLERVFEINRSFRNEGISSRHNPEFTMMELYMAYADYRDIIAFTEKLLSTLTKRVLGSNLVHYGDYLFDFSKPFTKMTMKEAIYSFLPEIHPESLDQIESAVVIAKSLGINLKENWGLGRVQTEIFENTVHNHLQQPTFITSYPTEVSPLARCNDKDPFFTDRFELFIGGYEIGNGFSELNDAEDQAERFYEQARAKNVGNENIISYDEEYITALEYGLPPTAGLGIGIDRLVMLLTDSHTIRDVILFPMLRLQR